MDGGRQLQIVLLCVHAKYHYFGPSALLHPPYNSRPAVCIGRQSHRNKQRERHARCTFFIQIIYLTPLFSFVVAP